MDEMKGVPLNGTAVIDDIVHTLKVRDQVFERVICLSVEYQSETTFGFVLTEQHHRPGEIRILEEWLRDEQHARFGVIHMTKIEDKSI
jgi:hypothetical protein